MLNNRSGAFIDVTKHQLAWSIVEIIDHRDYRAKEVASGIAVGEFDLTEAADRLETVVAGIRLFGLKCPIGINACWGVATYWVQNFCAKRETCTPVFVSEFDGVLKLPTKEKHYYRFALKDVNNIARDYRLSGSGELTKVALALAHHSADYRPSTPTNDVQFVTYAMP